MKTTRPSPAGRGTYAELDGDNTFDGSQTADAWKTPLPSVKGYPDSLDLRNGNDVPTTLHTSELLTVDATVETISVPIHKTASWSILEHLAWGHVYTNEGAGAAVTGTLPSAKRGMEVTVLDVNATYRISLDPGTELINGATTDQTTSAQWGSITIKCYVDGAWIVTEDI
jgi:hypothetical protein